MFIVFEGVDFVGKTTVSKMLHAKLARMFPTKQVVWHRAPDGPIREVLLNRDSIIDGEAELLLFTACHRWIISNNVKPVLDKGGIVVLDRFIDSTISYQGGGRGLGVEYVQKMMKKHVPREYRPDHTVFVTAPEEVREQRRLERGALDFMDQQGMDFRRRNADAMQGLYNGYENDYYANPKTAMMVSQLENDGPIEQIEAYLDDWLEQHKLFLLAANLRWERGDHLKC